MPRFPLGRILATPCLLRSVPEAEMLGAIAMPGRSRESRTRRDVRDAEASDDVTAPLFESQPAPPRSVRAQGGGSDRITSQRPRSQRALALL
jgi:hypothetical protein